MSVQATTADSLFTSTLSPYSKFKIALKSKEVQRQYPNLLERFLDFCKFEGLDVEQKAIKFCRFAKSKSQEEVEGLVIRFVLFHKDRLLYVQIPRIILLVFLNRIILLNEE